MQHKELKIKQLKKPSELCEISKRFWIAKPKSVFQKPSETITGETIGLISKGKTKRPEDCLLKLKPYAKNWAEPQSEAQNQRKLLEKDVMGDVKDLNYEYYHYKKNNKKTVYANSFSRHDKTMKEALVKAVAMTAKMSKDVHSKKEKNGSEQTILILNQSQRNYNQVSFSEPGSLYRYYHIKANSSPISAAETGAYRDAAQRTENKAAEEAVRAMRNLQTVLDCKAQICLSKTIRDNYWGDHWLDIKRQNQEARRLLIKTEALCKELGRTTI
ncbi:hypothetical protein E3N88_30597 [Mikania micrantha]|uniref:Uncharacterized protein n=1 Tax=Mikania micrantha TaxID=192012 RepID=A0A5N6MMI9_9ASTR|nr:hypothetical protein E3N88_30597 [Mikania micrantha]